MSPRAVELADTGLKIDYGHGQEPATLAQLNRALTLAVAMQKRRVPIVHVPPARPRERRIQGTYHADVPLVILQKLTTAASRDTSRGLPP
jgi:hypothetical protein